MLVIKNETFSKAKCSKNSEEIRIRPADCYKDCLPLLLLESEHSEGKVQPSQDCPHFGVRSPRLTQLSGTLHFSQHRFFTPAGYSISVLFMLVSLPEKPHFLHFTHSDLHSLARLPANAVPSLKTEAPLIWDYDGEQLW